MMDQVEISDNLLSRMDNEPKHSPLVITVIFSILGLGQLLPWNCFINSDPYWQLKFSSNETEWEARTPDHPVDRTTYQDFWTSALALATMSISTVFMILNMVLASKISQNARIYPTLVTMLTIFAYTAFMTEIDTASWVPTFFVITLLTAMICQASAGMYQGAAMSFGSEFPMKYLNAMLQGQAIAGVFASCLQILTMLFFKKEIIDADGNTVEIVDNIDAALMYFIIATFTVVVCIILYYTLLKMDYTKWIISKRPQKSEMDSDPSFGDIINQVITASKMVTYQALSLTTVFWVTIGVFPAVTARAISECSDDSESWWCTHLGGEFYNPVFNFLLFNITDWAGRFLAGQVKLIGKHNGKMLLVAALARWAIAGWFLAIRTSDYSGLSFFGQDWAFIVIMIFFGMTNGYIAALAFEYAPAQVDSANAGLIGSIMPVFMGFGLLSGAATSFLTVIALPSDH